MKEKIKKLLCLAFNNKRTFLVLLFFILIGICLPLKSAFAQWDWIVSTVTAVGSYIIAIFFLVAAAISMALLALAQALFKGITGPEFVGGMGYTRNYITEAGLNITQGFTNMVLVLILVFIALAIILRLRDYEAKKLLPTFIIVALLVNFAPVFCGLIVDAANIIMYYFLENLGNFGLIINQFTSLGQTFMNDLPLKDRGDIVAQIGLEKTAFRLVSITAFNFILAFFLLIFAFIFLFRYVAIWILVILSPLAFVFYILPKTQKIFWQWLNQLINWSFIGVTFAFFFYLAEATIRATNFTGEEKIGDIILANSIPVAFLGLGLIFGLTTAAMGSAMIIKGAQRSGKWVGAKAWRGMNLPEKRWLPTFKKGWMPIDFKNRRSPKEVAERITRTWEKIPVAKWFRPEPLKKYGEFRAAVETAKKDITGPSDYEMDRVAKGTYTGVKAAAALDAIIRDRGDSEDLIKAYKRKYYGTEDVEDKELFSNERFLQDKTLSRVLTIIKNTGNIGKIYRTDPRLAKIGKDPSEFKDALIEPLKNAKPGDISKWEREVIDDLDVMETFLAVRTQNDFRAIGGLKGGVLARQEHIDKLFSRWVDKGVDEGRISNKTDPNNWNKYIEHLKEEYKVERPGFVTALGNPRFESEGWREAQYKYPIASPPPPAGTPEPEAKRKKSSWKGKAKGETIGDIALRGRKKDKTRDKTRRWKG